METEVTLVGLSRERERIDKALGNRESLLLLGPRGAGKSRLLHEVVAQRPEAVYLRCPPEPHEFLVSLARRLSIDVRLPSVRLRGLLWKTLEASPRILVLDGVHHAGRAVRSFLEGLSYAPGGVILAAARGYGELGALGRLFWDPRQTVRLEPLLPHEARLLFEAAAGRFGLRALELDEFREYVLECARGNPGEIVEMCRLASHPRYLAGARIKFHILRIDALMHLGG